MQSPLPFRYYDALFLWMETCLALLHISNNFYLLTSSEFLQ